MNKKVFTIIFAIVFVQISGSQNYPPSEIGEYPDSRPHQNPTTFPGLLEPFTVDVNDLQVTRISDKNMSSNPTGYQMRHDYSKDQCWNADGSEIMLSAYNGQAQILDGETYEFLRWAQNIPSRQRWSYTNPDLMYGVSGNRLVSVHATTGVVATLHTFTEYTSIDLGLGEGNQSNDDRYWAILGKRNGWGDTDFVTYDLLTDTVLGTLSQGDLGGLIDWVSMTQNGEYFVVRYNAYGSGTKQGIKRWNKNFTGQFNIWSNPQHGDIGIGVNGNPVWVTIGSGVGHYLHMTDMVTGVTTGLIWQEAYGIEGAHVSCRNVNRPGWAYISVEPPVSDPNRHRMTREMFAVKLDNSDTFERWGFHNASSRVYWQQPHVTPNHDGTKVMFASSWGSTTIDNESYAPTFVTEIGSGNAVNISAGDDVSICDGETTTLTASGGFTYSWNNGESGEVIEVSPTTTTTYIVTAFAEDGAALDTDDVIVTVNQTPIANSGEDVATCLGAAATLTATGGTGSASTTYLWSTLETTKTITVNPTVTTSYTVEVFENNCSSTDEVIVTVNEVPIVDAGEDQSIFDFESATLTATGADSYLWSTGETTQSITVNPLSDTSYFVTGTTNNCENTDTVTVFLLDDSVNANAGADTVVCIGQTTILTATGGTTYLWSTGENTPSIEVSPAVSTTYTVTAYSLSGVNFEDDSVIVIVNDIPVANLGEDVAICFGNVTTLTASGGTSYLWNTGETTETITVSPDITTIYTVEAFENNCSSIDEIEVIVNELPETNAGDDVSIIAGESTTLIATGADSYLWSTGEITPSINVEPSVTTTYTVLGTNSKGCEFSDSVIVSVGAESVTANAGANVTICNGENTTLIATGGASYLWSTGETTASINVSPTESTSYTVTAFNEATAASDDDSVTVTVNDLPETNAGNNITIFEGDSTMLTVTGADSYVWSTGETTSSITVSPTVTTAYSVIGNSNGCESNDDVIVSVETENINANAGTNVAICNGESTTLTANGGASYVWSTGQTTASIEVSPTVTTAYTVTAFSSNGTESDDDSVTVTVNEIPVADAGNDVTICFGNETILSASGGTTYLWNTGETTQNITVNPNNTTTYAVEVFSNNCSTTDEVVITVNDLPETNAGNDVTIIEGDSTTLTATGAESYLWSTGETTSSISFTPNTTTTYSVTGVSNGCESIDDVTITVEPYTASAGANQTICQGYETTLTASEGDSYLWSTGETTQSITVNPTNSQTFTVTVYEGNYQADAEVQVGVNPNPNVVISNGDDIMILEGEFITLSASGANSYEWNNGATQPNIAVSPSTTTTYEVTGFINNCEDTTAILVNVLEIVQADAGEDLIICNQEIVTLTANGGDEYLWSNGETTQSIEVSPNVDTEYSVLVYNALDSDEDSVIVFVEECSTVEIPIESDTFDFLIYQDPTTDILKVRIDGLQSVAARGYSIYDLTGKLIYTEIFDPSDMEDLSQMTRELDVSTYSRGVYMIRLNYDDTSLIKKIPII